MQFAILFEPGQRVLVKGLDDMPGRISKVTIFAGPSVIYTVEYWHDGKLQSAELWSDELQPCAS